MKDTIESKTAARILEILGREICKNMDYLYNRLPRLKNDYKYRLGVKHGMAKARELIEKSYKFPRED